MAPTKIINHRFLLSVNQETQAILTAVIYMCKIFQYVVSSIVVACSDHVFKHKGLKMEETTIELNSDPLSDIFDLQSSHNETFYNYLPTTCVEKFTICLGDRNDSDSSSTDSSDIKTGNHSNTETYDGWNKSDKTPKHIQLLETSGLNVDTDDPADISQLVCAVIGVTSCKCLLSSQICIIGRMSTNRKFPSYP